MAGSSIQPWSAIRADFGDSNQALGIASRGFSDAGTIFGKLRDSFLKLEQDAIDNAFREKQLAENARQFGITSTETARNNNMDFYSTLRGQDTVAQTAANRLGLDTKELGLRERQFGLQEAEALRAQKERDAVNQATLSALQGNPKANEQITLNDARIQEINRQLSTPTGGITGSVLDLFDPALSGKGKEDLMNERNQLQAANKQLMLDTLPAKDRQEFNDRINRSLATSGFGYVAAPTFNKEAEAQTSYARALDTAVKTAEASRLVKQDERDFKVGQDLAKAAREAKSDAKKTLSGLLSKSPDDGKMPFSANYRSDFNQMLERLDTMGIDPRDVAAVLSRYDTQTSNTFTDTNFQQAVQDFLDASKSKDTIENSTLYRQMMIEARNNNRLPGSGK